MRRQLTRAKRREAGRFLLIASNRKQTAFTLIEILIVAALISLLAGIAIINIQSAYQSNQRKATLGEGRSVATALSFAYEDVGIYPKLCFLSQGIFDIAPPQTAPYTQPGTFLLSGFEYTGYDVNTPATMTNRIIKNWVKGAGSQGYFSAGSGRRGLFQGRRGGIVKMEIPMDIYNPQVLPSGQALPIYDWPADPWGRPYVVYMLIRAGNQSSGLPLVRFPNSTTDIARGNIYALAVVSYGPNGIPGGPEDYNAATLAMGLSYCLYSRDDRLYPGPPGQSDYRALRPQEYNAARRDAWSYVKLLGQNPPSYIGVIDPGSDDLIIDIP
jgi:prepilin-type N-terminal cleavage/methylation domain-containing protein